MPPSSGTGSLLFEARSIGFSIEPTEVGRAIRNAIVVSTQNWRWQLLGRGKEFDFPTGRDGLMKHSQK